ncbi:hypothetical protein [Streptomyces sp. NBC_00470]|uniref:hypothetical protein n=1 Tax=Streptomyces sp. NBC_00470 TaxID=2975753 RepID=UPI002F90D257
MPRTYQLSVPTEMDDTGALLDLIVAVEEVAVETADAADGGQDLTVQLGIEHLQRAHDDAQHAYFNEGDNSRLLGVLYHLIGAGAALADRWGVVTPLEPYTGDSHPLVLAERGLLETVRAQMNAWLPDLLSIPAWAPDNVPDAPALSGTLAAVLETIELTVADTGGDPGEVRGAAYLADARTHARSAAYGHGGGNADGDARLLAVLRSLILAADNLT